MSLNLTARLLKYNSTIIKESIPRLIRKLGSITLQSRFVLFFPSPSMLSVLPIIISMRFSFHFLLLHFFLFLSFFLFDFVVLLHFINNESFSVSLIVNTRLRIKKSLSIVGIQHFLKQIFSLFQISILNNLMSVIAEPQKEPSQTKKCN